MFKECLCSQSEGNFFNYYSRSLNSVDLLKNIRSLRWILILILFFKNWDARVTTLLLFFLIYIFWRFFSMPRISVDIKSYLWYEYLKFSLLIATSIFFPRKFVKHQFQIFHGHPSMWNFSKYFFKPSFNVGFLKIVLLLTF